MQQWEYLKEFRPLIEEPMTKYGLEGWELVAATDEWLFFKRPLQTPEDTTSSNP